MFCYQCDTDAKGRRCNLAGVCGKDATTAGLQTITNAVKGIAMYAHRARKLGASDRELDRFVVEAMFTTVTNVNFDPARLRELLRRAFGASVAPPANSTILLVRNMRNRPNRSTDRPFSACPRRRWPPPGRSREFGIRSDA